MQTIDFKTQTNFISRKNPSVKGFWAVALDLGYSAVKGFSQNSVFSFPSYAKKVSGDCLGFGKAGSEDIQYRCGKEIWDVGTIAQNSLSQADVSDSITALYGRNRYFSPMFLVIARVGIALGCLENEWGSPKNKKLIIQTGLPPAYIKSDSILLKEALSGKHEFELKIGAGEWEKFTFTLNEEDIQIMPQPMGSLLSASFDNNCRQIPKSEDYFSSVLIFDGGFGTLDTFSVVDRRIDSSETFDFLGMKRVLQETVDEIYKQTHAEVSVSAMQKCLDDGFIKIYDRKNRKTEKKDFTEILQKANREVCNEALEKIRVIYNDLFDHKYLLVTGGTGAAWLNIITEYFSGMEDLKIISGNQNDDLSHIFSNVRGYYMFLIGSLRRKFSQSDKK